MDTWYQWNQTNSHSTNEVQVNGTTVWQIHEDNIEIYNHIDKVEQFIHLINWVIFVLELMDMTK